MKNIAKIAYLNKYVYNNDKIHNIILGGSIPAQSIKIINTEFDITMTSVSFQHHGRTYINNHIIKDAPQQGIHIENQIVNTYTLDILVKDVLNYKPWEWGKALDDAENNLKHLKFGPEVKNGLEEYIYKIKKEYNNSSCSDELEAWVKEGPDSLYENLKALNNFISTVNLYSSIKNQGEHYHCDERCDFIKACGSNLRIFGVDCADESKESKDDPKRWDQHDFAKVDRNRKDSNGGYFIYWTHVKPKSVYCDNPLWFLSLRIHFRLLEPYAAKKIEIGWIGRHLYLPCREDRYKNCSDLKCPRHPLNPLNRPYDPKKEYTNYLSQWPKPEPEPENEPQKTEKPEKTSNGLPENC